jgi:hypothetical protein
VQHHAQHHAQHCEQQREQHRRCVLNECNERRTFTGDGVPAGGPGEPSFPFHASLKWACAADARNFKKLVGTKPWTPLPASAIHQRLSGSGSFTFSVV